MVPGTDCPGPVIIIPFFPRHQVLFIRIKQDGKVRISIGFFPIPKGSSISGTKGKTAVISGFKGVKSNLQKKVSVRAC